MYIYIHIDVYIYIDVRIHIYIFVHIATRQGLIHTNIDRGEYIQIQPDARIMLPMSWLRLVGSLKLWVSFAKKPYKRNQVLQKRPIILRSLLIVATPEPGARIELQHDDIWGGYGQ